MIDEINYYEVLGVPRDATTSNIIKSYWRAKDRYDLDYLKREKAHAKRADDEEKLAQFTQDIHEAPERLREIEEAYLVLSSYIKRKAYDVALDSDTMNASMVASDNAVNLLLNEISADVRGRSKPSRTPTRPKPKTRTWHGDDPFDAVPSQLDSNRIMIGQSSSDTPFVTTNQQKSGVVVYKQSTPMENGVPIIVWIFAALFVMTAVGFFLLSFQEEPPNSARDPIVSVQDADTSPQTVATAIIAPTVTVAPQTNNETTTQFTQTEGLPTLSSNASTFADQAEGYYVDGRYRIAVTVYTQAIAQQEDAPQLYYGRALARWAFAEAQATSADALLAIADLEQAVTLDTTLAEAYGLLGIIHFERWKVGLGDNHLTAAEDAVTQYVALNTGEIPSQIESIMAQLDIMPE